ncbi:MAG: ABC transporter ATP-binding protein [Actinomycetota bacterium]
MKFSPTDAQPPDIVPLKLESISLYRDGATILDNIHLTVAKDQRWLVLGANGSGKTSLVRIAALYDHPSSGRVEILGETLGSTDVRALRKRVGYLSASLADSLRPQLTSLAAVMTAKNAALEPWWHVYDDADRRAADICLERMEIVHLRDREIGSLSSGELQRVLLARTLMNDPGVIVLDEPSARLDLGGREQLIQSLTSWTTDPHSPPVVLVTHHLDEVPPGITHVLMLKQGRVLVSGPIDSCLDAQSLYECFGIELRLERRSNGRFSAWS